MSFASTGSEGRRERLRAGAAVAAIHLAIGFALVAGLGPGGRGDAPSELKTFNVPVEPPPPPEREQVPAPERIDDPAGEAAPPSLRARPSPVVAPPTPLRMPPRMATAPERLPAPTGNEPTAGASDTDGPGTGAGGEGSGAGAGGSGSGTGGGGMTRAQRISGAFDYSDHPDRGRTDQVETVGVRFLVAIDGRVRDCTVTRSSGNARVDAATCRLIEQRFRYRPATDASGRPVASAVSTVFSWIPDQRRVRR